MQRERGGLGCAEDKWKRGRRGDYEPKCISSLPSSSSSPSTRAPTRASTSSRSKGTGSVLYNSDVIDILEKYLRGFISQYKDEELSYHYGRYLRHGECLYPPERDVARLSYETNLSNEEVRLWFKDALWNSMGCLWGRNPLYGERGRGNKSSSDTVEGKCKDQFGEHRTMRGARRMQGRESFSLPGEELQQSKVQASSRTSSMNDSDTKARGLLGNLNWDDVEDDGSEVDYYQKQSQAFSSFCSASHAIKGQGSIGDEYCDDYGDDDYDIDNDKDYDKDYEGNIFDSYGHSSHSLQRRHNQHDESQNRLQETKFFSPLRNRRLLGLSPCNASERDKVEEQMSKSHKISSYQEFPEQKARREKSSSYRSAYNHPRSEVVQQHLDSYPSDDYHRISDSVSSSFLEQPSSPEHRRERSIMSTDDTFDTTSAAKDGAASSTTRDNDKSFNCNNNKSQKDDQSDDFFSGDNAMHNFGDDDSEWADESLRCGNESNVNNVEGDEDQSAGQDRVMRRVSKKQTQILQAWLFSHLHNPFLTEANRADICKRADLPYTTIQHWLAKARFHKLEEYTTDSGETAYRIKEKSLSTTYTTETVRILREWLFNHRDNPFPSNEDCEYLSSQTGISRKNLGVWFWNNRQYMYTKHCEEREEKQEEDTVGDIMNTDKSLVNLVDDDTMEQAGEGSSPVASSGAKRNRYGRPTKCSTPAQAEDENYAWRKNLLKPNKAKPKSKAKYQLKGKSNRSASSEANSKARKKGSRPSTSARSLHVPKKIRLMLAGWLKEHLDNPFPTDEERKQMAAEVGLRVEAVTAWFAGARYSLLEKHRNSEGVDIYTFRKAEPRSSLNSKITQYLKNWTNDHLDNPYPGKEEKEILCARSGLSKRQLDHWFANCRGKLLDKTVTSTGKKIYSWKTREKKRVTRAQGTSSAKKTSI
eukprot:Nk52_evm12s1837 gene=Nk52_evmTU12s1837